MLTCAVTEEGWDTSTEKTRPLTLMSRHSYSPTGAPCQNGLRSNDGAQGALRKLASRRPARERGGSARAPRARVVRRGPQKSSLPLEPVFTLNIFQPVPVPQPTHDIYPHGSRYPWQSLIIVSQFSNLSKYFNSCIRKFRIYFLFFCMLSNLVNKRKTISSIIDKIDYIFCILQ